MDDLNSHVTIRKSEFVMQNSPQNKYPDPRGFIVEFHLAEDKS